MPRTCLFCDVPLTGANRAKEHIIPNSWLKRLGHSKVSVESIAFGLDQDIRTRTVAADQMQVGEVCEGCNNGWMRHLDEKLRELILDLATYKKRLGDAEHFTDANRLLLARWLLKTACVHEYSDAAHRRHIVTSIRRKMRRAAYLPPGLLLFASQTENPLRIVALSSLDVWDEHSLMQLKGTVQSQRIKFAIQLDSIIFGLVWINRPRPTYLMPFNHFPIYATGGVAIHPRPNDLEFDTHQLPESTHRHILLPYLASVGVVLRPGP